MAGLEPALPREHDFESRASTNSATSASFKGEGSEEDALRNRKCQFFLAKKRKKEHLFKVMRFLTSLFVVFSLATASLLGQSQIILEKRAAAYGFVRYLPQTIDSAYFMNNGEKHLKDFFKLPFVQEVEKSYKIDGGLYKMLTDIPELNGIIKTYGRHYLVAYGEGATEVGDALLSFLSEGLGFGVYLGIQQLDTLLGEGEQKGLEDGGKLGKLRNKITRLIKLFEPLKMPASYFVWQGIDEQDSQDTLKATKANMTSFFAEFGDNGIFSPISVKIGNEEFTGWKVDGKIIAQEMEKDKDSVPEFLGRENIEAAIATVREKKIVFLLGEHKGYNVLFVGSDEKDLVFADKAEESFCVSKLWDDLDSFLDKDIFFMSVSSEKMAQMSISPSYYMGRLLAPFFDGLREGLSQTKNLGDLSEIDILLETLGEQSKLIANYSQFAPLSCIGYFDKGLHIEGFGGGNIASLDLNKEQLLDDQSLSGSFIVAQWADNEEYMELLRDYIENIVATSYVILNKAVHLGFPGESDESMQQGIELFESRFKLPLLDMWSAIGGDLSKGLGSQNLFVMDFKSEMPKVPGLTEEILKKGKAPRLTYVAPVASRKALQDSWTKVHKSIESLLQSFGELSGESIPMQEPMTSSKDDLKTYFIPIPFANDDFLPSISVSDSYFFASSSKNLSEGLYTKLKEANAAPAHQKGAYCKVDFKVFHAYVEHMIQLLIENKEALELKEDDIQEVRKQMQLMRFLQGADLRFYKEGDQLRSSFYLKTL